MDEQVNRESGDSEIYQEVIKALKEIYDPEIPVNVYDLGLIYRVNVLEGGTVYITMTLTTPSCPVAEMIPGQVENRIRFVEGVKEVIVNLVWDPPWTKEMMSEEALLELGFM